MAVIMANEGVALDMFETAIGSALTPTVAPISATALKIQFDYGFADVLDGSGFAVDGDGQIVGGTITRITEFQGAQQAFAITDLSLSAPALGGWLATGNYQGVLDNILAGNDTIVGSDLDDRIYAGEGSDTIRAGAGDDELYGDGGNDILMGGDGSDYLDGGAGLDRARYDGFRVSYTLDFAANSSTVQGAGQEGIDTLTDVEELQFRDGVLTLDPDAIGATIVRLYDTVFHRVPGQVELEDWINLVEGGMTLPQVAAYYLGSAEFRGFGIDIATDESFVDFLFRSSLGREADPGGRAYWIGQLRAGMTRSDALFNVSESTEHRDRTSALTAQGYFHTDADYQTIAYLFDGFANRLPDAGGLAYWAEQLKTGARTLGEIGSLFVASAEFRGVTQGMSNAQMVDYMFHNALDRDADAGGRAYWINALDHGLSKSDLLIGFALSDEHRQLMSTYVTGGIDLLF